ncbi:MULTISPECIES: hypothetical protein [unclassified Microcoleus]|uniref:hypothetical protein n=1 Tax=unclassified Microcoleus TaxID=2642155 RepID=UPI002FD0B198
MSADWCGDIARIVLVAESKGNKGWGSIARSAEPAQKADTYFPIGVVSHQK